PAGRALPVAAVLAAAGAAHLVFAPAAPAVVLLVVDCLRADRLAPSTMPEVASLFADSTRFTQARSQSSWTRSAMPSLLSGRYPVEHGLYHTRPRPDRIREGVPMLAEHFRDAGWLTAGFAEQPQLDAAFGFDRGFGHYRFRSGLAKKLNARFLTWNAVFRTVPRFVFLHYVDVHGPYTPKKAFRPKRLPQSELKTSTSRNWRAVIEGVREGRIQLTEADTARLAALYDGEVRQLDANLGDLLDALRADGTLDASWLVLTADHGERFGEHGDLEHMRTPDEVVLAVPLLVRPPGGGPAREVVEIVQHVDVAPTLLALAGIARPPDLPGRDLTPALAGEALAPTVAFAEEWAGKVHRAAVREGDWKLVRDPEPRLFDLDADPGETRDLAAERPDVVARLEGQLAAYFAAGARGEPIARVDWEAAARSGERWTPTRRGEGAAPEVDDETMEALEALGYLEDE
ncbi:MAG: sulfatase, partial [Myxococcota bacterium]